jgi:hypothetical protein
VHGLTVVAITRSYLAIEIRWARWPTRDNVGALLKYRNAIPHNQSGKDAE